MTLAASRQLNLRGQCEGRLLERSDKLLLACCWGEPLLMPALTGGLLLMLPAVPGREPFAALPGVAALVGVTDAALQTLKEDGGRLGMLPLPPDSRPDTGVRGCLVGVRQGVWSPSSTTSPLWDGRSTTT